MYPRFLYSNSIFNFNSSNSQHIQDKKTMVREDTEMSRSSRKYLLLFLILAFAFGYRVMLMLWADFPPGADIGLHNSVIHSITPSGNTDFLWNNYQMGGGLSLTFPGYHILVSQVILLSGLPDFLAHTLVVALFSTLIVACAFLITRKMWTESAAFIVAFLVAVSRFDVEMLMWGGYPNVITLMLIPLIFYLFLQSERFSLSTFLATASLLCGALFLTHSLSALVFDGTALVIVIFVAILSKKLVMPKKRLAVWLAPLFLGALLVSPFLVDAVPAYLGANSETFTGGVPDIRLALLSTRILPWELLAPLVGCVIFFFLLSKEYKGKYLTVPALLLTFWILVPVAFTQGYFVGFYIDYNRFLYFVLLPVIILIGLVIDHLATFFSKVADVYLSVTKQTWQTNKTALRLAPHLNRKNFYAGIVLFSLLFSFFAVQLFMTPWQGTTIQGFYQVMNDPGYDAINWAQKNTPTNSVFVSDALYGWWFSGFAQRPTLSAVDPQYLTLEREFEPAKAAKNLLDTDYVIDNGLIQVREDGGYVGRHNPMFLAKLNWSYFPYPFLNFNNNETTVLLTEGDADRSFDLSQLPVTEMRVETASDNASAAIYVSKGNSLFNYTQVLTVYKGVQFVNMSVTLESNVEDVTLRWVSVNFQTKGKPIDKGNTVGFFDEGGKVLGQLIFAEGQPEVYQGGPTLRYMLSGEPKAEFEIWASAFPVSDSLTTYEDPKTIARLTDVMADKLASYQQKGQVADLPLDIFDYKKTLVDWNVSYIAVRDPEIIPKFTGDPAFSLLFINDEVAVFIVK
jgi:hypothetical protein